MAKVIVCRYTVYDIVRGESFVAPRWATRDTIARIRGAAIIEPCVEIDETSLNVMGLQGKISSLLLAYLASRHAWVCSLEECSYEHLAYDRGIDSTRSYHRRKWVRPETAGGAVWRSGPMLSAGCLQGWLIVAG